jgi:hypothetical protein
VVCGKIPKRQREVPASAGEAVQCSDKRVAYCDEKTSPLCNLKQHKSAHASKAVEFWFAPKAKEFIAQRLAAAGNHANPDGEPADPCGFVEYPARCGLQ